MPVWKKMYILFSIVLILGLNAAAFIVYFTGELNCSSNKDPYAVETYYNDRVASEIDDVLGKDSSDTYTVTPVYTPVAPDNSGKTMDAAVNAFVYAALTMFVPNIFLIAIAIVLYKGFSWRAEGEDGTAKKRFVLAGVLGGVFIVLLLVGIFGISSYIKKAKSADLNGEFTFTYPRYIENEGWNVTASSDGTLTDNLGNRYDFLFWEATMVFDQDTSRGFCVRGCDTEAFLKDAAEQLGLNAKEAKDFVSYWTPYMRDNAYNVISFQTTGFDEAARLDICPQPDVVLRVNMLWYPSDEYVNIKPQSLSEIGLPQSARHGLTAVEWGGEMLEE